MIAREKERAALAVLRFASTAGRQGPAYAAASMLFDASNSPAYSAAFAVAEIANALGKRATEVQERCACIELSVTDDELVRFFASELDDGLAALAALRPMLPTVDQSKRMAAEWLDAVEAFAVQEELAPLALVVAMARRTGDHEQLSFVVDALEAHRAVIVAREAEQPSAPELLRRELADIDDLIRAGRG